MLNDGRRGLFRRSRQFMIAVIKIPIDSIASSGRFREPQKRNHVLGNLDASSK
jgi:hypothetical protein